MVLNATLPHLRNDEWHQPCLFRGVTVGMKKDDRREVFLKTEVLLSFIEIQENFKFHAEKSKNNLTKKVVEVCLKETQVKLFLKFKLVPYQIANYTGLKFSLKHREICSVLGCLVWQKRMNTLSSCRSLNTGNFLICLECRFVAKFMSFGQIQILTSAHNSTFQLHKFK